METENYKIHPVPVYIWPKLPPEPTPKGYFITRKDGTRELSKKAKEEIKKRLDEEFFAT